MVIYGKEFYENLNKEYNLKKNEYKMFLKSILLTGLLSEGITLPPKTERKIYIHFMPKELGSFGFLLPAIINNILGPPNSREEKSVLVKNYIKSIVKW